MIPIGRPKIPLNRHLLPTLLTLKTHPLIISSLYPSPNSSDYHGYIVGFDLILSQI